MAKQPKNAGVTGVVYVGPSNEVELRVLPGVRFEYGLTVEVPTDLAKRMTEKPRTADDKIDHDAERVFVLASEAKVDRKRRALAKRVTEAERGPEWTPAQNDPDDEIDSPDRVPDLDAGDPNPSPDAPPSPAESVEAKS